MNWLFHVDWQRRQGNQAKKCAPKNRIKTVKQLFKESQKKKQLAEQDSVLPLVGICESQSVEQKENPL